MSGRHVKEADSSMGTAQGLLTKLRNAGLTVVEEPGWETRGNNWAEGGPVGIIEHHTAPPNPYPIKRLYGNGEIKCNMATHEDGTVYMVAYDACNYSSGPGSRVVLDENVRKSIPPPDNARDRGLYDTPGWGGNRYYWNFENSHPGDSSPIPDVQLRAIIIASHVVAEHFGLNPNQTISHAEHSRRKIDPRWNGDNRTAINQIREGMRQLVDYRGVKNVPDKDWAREVVDNCIDTWKIINVNDDTTDDWNKPIGDYGTMWILFNRALKGQHPEELE